MMKPDYSTFPTKHMIDGVRMWIEHGVHPGSFLSAVISNDLRGACERADDLNRSAIFYIVRWFYNEAPCGCWGSIKVLQSWRGTKEGEAA